MPRLFIGRKDVGIHVGDEQLPIGPQRRGVGHQVGLQLLQVLRVTQVQDIHSKEISLKAHSTELNDLMKGKILAWLRNILTEEMKNIEYME